MNKTLAFPGRILFDHLPKTAGTATATWLTSVLGTGCVSPQVNGLHRKLISQYGGTYSVISAHMDFDMGDMLDPRYTYVTCLRDPIDRAVSWLYYVLDEYKNQQDTKLYQSVSRLLESDGQELDNDLIPNISNLYVNHFSRIGATDNTENRLSVAHCLKVLAQYDLIGLQEDMLAFIYEFGKLIGSPPTSEVARHRVTPARPSLSKIKKGLKKRLIELNQLDLQLYKTVASWQRVVIPPQLTLPQWQKYERQSGNRLLTTPDLIISKAELQDGAVIEYGQVMTFTVDFFLSRDITGLGMGIHIFDDEKRWAFGTNNILLKQIHENVETGSYSARYYLIADLPTGRYTAGFSFTERLAEGINELAWSDVACEFHVRRLIEQQFAGYAYLPTELSLLPTHDADDARIIAAPQGSIFTTDSIPAMQCNQTMTVEVVIANCGKQHWVGDVYRPVNIAFRWAQNGNTILEGERSALPHGGIRAGQTATTSMLINAPALPGHYALTLTLVQETIGWFDVMSNDFKPTVIHIIVEPNNAGAQTSSEPD
ncbi:MAG: Wzt carbohydrate-binding domain-containing protein [Sulfuriferula sp.]